MSLRFIPEFSRLIGLALLMAASVGGADTAAWADTSRWIGLFPNLLDSPVRHYESRMMNSPVEYFESRMPNSPAQLIGSPFGPYRFATLPSAVELRVTRRSVWWLPAMFHTPQGTLLVLPPYVLPQSLRPTSTRMPARYAEAPIPSEPRTAPPKFIILRCGRYIEVNNLKERTLRDKEQEPCYEPAGPAGP